MKKQNRLCSWIVAIVLIVLMAVTALPLTASADPVYTDPYGHKIEWWNFRNSQDNNAVTDRPTPTNDQEAWGKWAMKYGNGYAAAPTPPIIVDDKLYIGMDNVVLELNKETGQVIRTSQPMPGKVGYAMQSPVYADGKIFVAITNGRVCAVNISDMSVAWTTDNTQIIRGQTVSPISYVKIGQTGYIYTGTWTKNGGTFFCASTDDNNVLITTDGDGNEIKTKLLTWSFDPSVVDAENLELNDSVAIGYYWTGAYVAQNYLAIGSDNGSTLGDSVNDTAFYTLNPLTGEIIDAVYGIKGQVRSTAVYKDGHLYFSTKGAKIYKIPVDDDGHLGTPSYIDMGNFGALMATATPVVYGGKIYLGVQGQGNQFSADGGHGFLVARDDPVLSNESFLYNLSVPGYPQAGALLSNYHEEEDFDADGSPDGRVYLFFTYNARPGGIYYTYDTPDQTEATILTTEESRIFVPAKDKQEYCISSIVADEEGTLYYKNDSCYLFAVESNPAAMADVRIYDEQGNEFSLDQPFMTKMAEYSTTVPSKTETVNVVLDLFEGVSATINGVPYQDGGLTVSLDEDVTQLSIVTDKSGKSRTYEVTVNKESANACLANLGSAKGNTPPSPRNQNTRPMEPVFDKDITQYTFDWITTGTGDNYDPAGTNQMNLFVKAESDKATLKVWPGENTLMTNTNEDGSIKQYASSNGFQYRYPVYSADITRDSTARIVVTAEDGQTQMEYQVLFSRRVYVSDLTLNESALKLCEGEEYQLEAAVVPDNATDPTVTWYSSDDAVATVDETGKVAALSEGEVVITAEAEDGTVKAECHVEVVKEEEVTLLQVTGQNQKNRLIEKDGKPVVLEAVTVSAANARLYGYAKPDAVKANVTALDALIELHLAYYGDTFAADPKSYLEVDDAGTVTRVFGETTGDFMFHVNDACPYYESQPDIGRQINDTALKDGDSVRFFRVFGDLYGMDNAYLTLDQKTYDLHEGKTLSLTVEMKYVFSGIPGLDQESWKPAKDAVCVIADEAGTIIAQTAADEEGLAEFEPFDSSILPEGEYYITVTSYTEEDYDSDVFVPPYAKLTVTAHQWDAGMITLAPGCETEGSRHFSCLFEDCEAEKTEAVPAAGHELFEVAGVEATCDSDGMQAYYICKKCGKLFADEEAQIELDDTGSLFVTGGHVWDEGVVKTMEECGGAEVTVYTCQRDSSHTRILAAEKEGHMWEEEYATDEEASCERAGSESLHCAVCHAIDPDSIRSIEAGGHQYRDWEIVTEPSCEEPGVQQRICANDETHVEIRLISPTGHTLSFLPEKEASCEEAGNAACWQCEVCEKTFLDEDALNEVSFDEIFTEPTGHRWVFDSFDWEGNDAAGYQAATGRYVCEKDAEHVCSKEAELNVIKQDASCETDGKTAYGAVITEENSPDGRIHIDSKEVTIPATGHNWDAGVVTQKPANGNPGVMTYTCKNDPTHTRTEEIPYVALKKILVSPTSAEIGAGKKLALQVSLNPVNASDDDLSWESSDPAVAKVDKNGVITAVAYGKATITARSANGKTASCKVQVRFSDALRGAVPDEMFDAIYWAADQKITGEKVRFGTFNSLSRGQFVRFLYRLAGQPKVKNTANPFKDIDKNYTHYKAIMWAVGEGLIAGYSDGTFKPGKNVSRSNVATILWKFAGSPKVKNAKKPYADVSKSTAITWGKQKGILSEPTGKNGKPGTAGRYKPNEDCLRGDLILYLYRYNRYVK